MALLLHCLLDKGYISPAYQTQLKEMCAEVTRERYMDELLAEYWAPPLAWRELAAAIREDRWALLIDARPAISRRLAQRDPGGTWARKTGRRALRRLSLLTGLLRPTGWSVALLAADGAGKSTLTARLQEGCSLPVYTSYMGLYQKRRGTQKRRKLPTGMGLLSKLATQWGRYLQAHVQRARGRLVIFDRYPYDALLPSNPPPSLLGQARRWLLAYTCPPPDQVIVLDAPADVLRERKQEHSLATLDHRRRNYLGLQERLPQVQVVDTTREIEEVYRELSSLIWEKWSHRLGRKAQR